MVRSFVSYLLFLLSLSLSRLSLSDVVEGFFGFLFFLFFFFLTKEEDENDDDDDDDDDDENVVCFSDERHHEKREQGKRGGGGGGVRGGTFVSRSYFSVFLSSPIHRE